jgi:hypothetical protein
MRQAPVVAALRFRYKLYMRQVTVYTTDKEYSHFVELAKNLHYVKKIETDEGSAKKAIVNNLKKGFEEMKLIKKGELKTTSLDDFLNEL